jgi:hypothetical protein
VETWWCLNGSGDGQVSDFGEDLFHAIVQVASGILISGLRIKILLDLSHATVRFGAESELDFDERFERRIEVWDAEIDELGEFGEELFVELLVGLLCHFGLSLCARQFGHVLVGLFYQLLDLGADGVVVEELVVAFLDAFVDVGEVGAEAGDGFEDSRSGGLQSVSLQVQSEGSWRVGCAYL